MAPIATAKEGQIRTEDYSVDTTADKLDYIFVIEEGIPDLA